MNNLQELMRHPQATFVDVRSPGEFHSGHVKNALNIPLDEIQERVEEIRSLNGPVFCYCRSGARSAMAVQLLSRMQVPEVYNAGGIDSLISFMF